MPPMPAMPPVPPTQPPYSQVQLTPQLPPGGMVLPNGPGMVKQEPAIKTESVMIKQEPGLPNQPMPTPQFGGPTRATEAAVRATQNLQATYGSRATNSINAIQAGMGGQRAQGPPQQGNQAQHRPGQLPNGQSGLQAAQTDGAGDENFDYEGVLMQRDAMGNLAEMGRVDIDRLLHAQIAAKAKEMEGGGLMLPLKEATKHRTAQTARARPREGGPSNFDGLDDDELDEDAINSDLDDPEEKDDEDDDDDDQLQHVMLCMYDKVQRVKNKWYVCCLIVL
jgi:transcription initiation factor TFIIA large subunit